MRRRSHIERGTDTQADPVAAPVVDADDWINRLRNTCGHYYGLPHAGRRHISGDVRLAVRDGLEVAELSGDFARIERTCDGVRRDTLEHAFLLIPRVGALGIEHDGHRTQLRPGELLLLDSTRPASILPMQGRADFVSVHVPRHEFLERCDGPPHYGQRLLPDSAATQALVDVLKRLLDEKAPEPMQQEPERTGVRSCAAGAARLVHALAGVACSSAGQGQARLRASQLDDDGSRVRLAELLIDQHLKDESLTLAWLANRLGLSTRHLQRLMAAEGLSFSDVVRRKRLAQVAASLRRAHRAGERANVSAAAFDSGFRDLSNFNRAFRARFDASPRQWLARLRPLT